MGTITGRFEPKKYESLREFIAEGGDQEAATVVAVDSLTALANVDFGELELRVLSARDVEIQMEYDKALAEYEREMKALLANRTDCVEQPVPHRHRNRPTQPNPRRFRK